MPRRVTLVQTDNPPVGQVFNGFPDRLPGYAELFGKGSDRYTPIPRPTRSIICCSNPLSLAGTAEGIGCDVCRSMPPDLPSLVSGCSSLIELPDSSWAFVSTLKISVATKIRKPTPIGITSLSKNMLNPLCRPATAQSNADNKATAITAPARILPINTGSVFVSMLHSSYGLGRVAMYRQPPSSVAQFDPG